jgi:hypothetical protein
MRPNYVPLCYKQEILHTSLLFTLCIQYLICLEHYGSQTIKEYEMMFNTVSYRKRHHPKASCNIFLLYLSHLHNMANFIPTEMFQMLVWNLSSVSWTVTG